MKLLVTGANGQVGSEVVEVARNQGHHVTALGHGNIETGGLDLEDHNSIQQALATTQPDVVIHCAAWTNVDACELNPQRAMAINGDATAVLATAAQQIGARVVYISTDYVFDGTHSEYNEDATPNPINEYGRSKLAGEQSLSPHDTIVRTSWVCGQHGHNIVKTVLDMASRSQPMSFVDDQIGRPTFVEDLAPALVHIATQDMTGVIHATNSTTLSWHQFAKEILTAGSYNLNLLTAIPTSELTPPRPAPRPQRSILVGKALALSKYGPMPPINLSLNSLVHHLRSS